MSILVRGMKMPKRGHTVTITIVGSGETYVEYYDCKPPVEETIEYKAVPVPPHGRLIDADALVADIKGQATRIWRLDAVSESDYFIERNEKFRQEMFKAWCESMFAYLDTRPTIIEREATE